MIVDFVIEYFALSFFNAADLASGFTVFVVCTGDNISKCLPHADFPEPQFECARFQAVVSL